MGRSRYPIIMRAMSTPRSSTRALGDGSTRRGDRGRRPARVDVSRARVRGARATTESDDGELASRRTFDVNAELEADIARYAKRRSETMGDEPSSSAGEPGAMDQVKEAIDTFLLYDFFVILFILAWLVCGVGVRLSQGNGLSYDEPFLGTWLFLWPFLFQPLLGVHMLATLVSPAIGYAKKKGIVSEDTWQ